MENLRITLSLVDGSAIVRDESTGEELIEALFGPVRLKWSDLPALGTSRCPTPSPA